MEEVNGNMQEYMSEAMEKKKLIDGIEVMVSILDGAYFVDPLRYTDDDKGICCSVNGMELDKSGLKVIGRLEKDCEKYDNPDVFMLTVTMLEDISAKLENIIEAEREDEELEEERGDDMEQVDEIQMYSPSSEMEGKIDSLGMRYTPFLLSEPVTVDMPGYDMESGQETFKARYAMMDKWGLTLFEDVKEAAAVENGVDLTDLPRKEQLDIMTAINSQLAERENNLTLLIDHVYLPEYALGAVINGDYTGLDDEKEKMVNAFVEGYHGDIIYSPTGESSFSSSPAFGKATDCEETFVIRRVTVGELMNEQKMKTVDMDNPINNNLIKEDADMAKKKTDAQEQTEEKKVKNPAAEKNEQPVKEQPKAEKQDGAWVSQVKDKNGQPVPGIYKIYLRENGELRKPVRLTVEERDAFFQGTKDMTKEEKNKVFNERALELAKVKFAPGMEEETKSAAKKVRPDGFHYRDFVAVSGGKEKKVHVIEMVQNGETSVAKRLNPEQVKDFYNTVSGNTKAERDAWIEKTGKELFPNGFESKKKNELTPVEDSVKERITNARLQTGDDGKAYIHATIDGVKKIGREVTDKKLLDAYFRSFMDKPKDSQERKDAIKDAATIVAAEVYRKDLERGSQKQTNGIKR